MYRLSLLRSEILILRRLSVTGTHDKIEEIVDDLSILAVIDELGRHTALGKDIHLCLLTHRRQRNGDLLAP